MGLCVSLQNGERIERRRLAKDAMKADEKAHELLADVRGRMWTNGASEASSLFTKQGRKGANQDCMLVWEGFTDESTVLCAVFDGHGPRGHRVAQKVRDKLPALLIANKTDMEVQYDWEKSLIAACIEMDEQLNGHPYINCAWSGTTAVMAIVQGVDIIIGNVGDSRAIIGRQVAGCPNWDCEQITVDLKPNVPEELQRIRRCKGRVFALADEPNVPRVWLPSGSTPGLAMARAFGDTVLKNYGLSALPQITQRRLTEGDKFLVIATDGVWDVLSNDEVVEIIASACDRKEEAAKRVVDMAVKQWRRKRSSALVDDCAVVCHFFEGKLMAPVAAEDGSETEKKVRDGDEKTRSRGAVERGETIESTQD